jgi:hypothetical protein
MNTVTIATAFFDIKREENGDGRSINEYLEWIKHTLQLNCNLYVVTEDKFRDFFLNNRPKHLPMHMKIIKFEESHYYRYYGKIKDILQSPEYKAKVMHPNRVECVLPEYNIIQYSKFHYLEMAIQENPFNSLSFFWMDAGISRFFLDVDISRPFPSKTLQDFLSANQDKIIIQKRHDLETYRIDDSFVWNSANLLSGGMFGGGKDVVLKIGEKVEQVFVNKMLKCNSVNNEQLALAMVWKEFPHLFITPPNVFGGHFSLFKLMSQ